MEIISIGGRGSGRTIKLVNAVFIILTEKKQPATVFGCKNPKPIKSSLEDMGLKITSRKVKAGYKFSIKH